MIFWLCRKNNLIGKARLISKFMTLQTGLQTCPMHICNFSNISQSKGNQTMKFNQLIERNKRKSFVQKLCGK